MTKGTCFMVAGLLLGAATGRAAEENPMGPLHLAVQVGAEATDNRDSAPRDEESNVDVKVTPRADLRLENGRSLLDGYYAPTFRWRSNPADVQNETELFHELGLELSHELSSLLEVNVREYYNLTDDPAITDGSGTLQRDGTYWMNRVQGALAVNLTSRLYSDLEAYNRIKRYDDELAASNLDEDMTSYGATLWYQVDRQLAALASVMVGQYGYDDTVMQRDFDSLYLGVGCYRLMANDMRIEARGGVVNAAYKDDTLEDDTAPSIELALRPSPKAATRATLAAGTMLRDADLAPFASQEYTYVSGVVAHDVGSHLVVNGELRWSQGDYSVLPAGATGLGYRSGTEELVLVGAGLLYRVTENSDITLRYEFVTTDSSAGLATDRSYDRNSTWLGYRVSL